MAYEDYSQSEITNICEELIFVYAGKLKQEECIFVNKMYHVNLIRPLENIQRDLIIKLYDNVSDGTLEG